MAEAFELLLGLRGIGTFLAYQLVTDLNYTAALGHSEMEFVMAGPGARSGIEKCFSDLGDYSVEDVIRWTADRQLDEMRERGLEFMDLWGRPLQLIDCQNLFCEVDKFGDAAGGAPPDCRRRQSFRAPQREQSRRDTPAGDVEPTSRAGRDAQAIRLGTVLRWAPES